MKNKVYRILLICRTIIVQKYSYIVLFIAVFFSRLPFLNNGYGLDADAWRIARAGLCMAKSGAYCCSRRPCYPLPEITYWLLAPTTDFVFNSITALLSAFGALFLSSILKRCGVRNYILAGLGFAFAPLYFINSTNAMDYVWAISFMLASIRFAMSKNPIISGFLIGLAISCRSTYAVMIPLLSVVSFFIYKENERKRPLFQFLAASMTVALYFYFPAIFKLKDKLIRLNYTSNKSFSGILSSMTLETYGLLGCIALIFLFVYLIVYWIRCGNRTIIRALSQEQILFLIISIFGLGIYSIIYLFLPLEAGYMIPTIPFIIILFSILLPPRVTSFAWILILISPFVFNSTLGTRKQCVSSEAEISITDNLNFCMSAEGALLKNYYKRKTVKKKYERMATAIKRVASSYDGLVVVFARGRAVRLQIEWGSGLGKNVKIKYNLGKSEMQKYKESGAKFIVFNDSNRIFRKQNKIDLSRNGAIKLNY